MWRLAAKSESGEDLGGIKLSSAIWGTRPTEPGHWDYMVPANKTWYGSRWFLRQDVHIREGGEVGYRQDASQLARAPSTVKGYEGGETTVPGVKVPTEYKDPVFYGVLKLYHDVIEEELPVQNGFSHMVMDITPNNLFGYNPNILMRYDPRHNDMMENVLEKDVYVAPYESEQGIPQQP